MNLSSSFLGALLLLLIFLCEKAHPEQLTTPPKQEKEFVTPADEAHLLHDSHCGYLSLSPVQHKYLIIGARDYTNIGIGNILAFFPAAHFFAIVSNRHIVIHDDSQIGVFCKVIRCGFPFLSEATAAYPAYFTKIDFGTFPGLKWKEMLDAVNNDKVLYNDFPVISASGLDSRSEWFVWKNTTRKCIARVTGCDEGDIGCAERFSFKTLVPGPFYQEYALRSFKEKIIGLNSPFKNAILHLPRSHAPRFHMAIHLRNQFDYFENEKNGTDVTSQTEIQTWLSSPEKQHLFDALDQEIWRRVIEIQEEERIKQEHYISQHNITGVNGIRIPPLNIFLSSDTLEVKEAFHHYITRNASLMQQYNVQIGYYQNKNSIYHIKFSEYCLASPAHCMQSLAFDWYCLSISNDIFAWRKNFGRGGSTFVKTARAVSGTKERTVNNAKIRAVGSTAHFVLMAKNGNRIFFERHIGHANVDLSILD